MGLQRITMEIPKSPADADSWMLFTREFLHIGTAEAGLASSRLVCRLRSQDGRTSFFEELFGRTISNRPSKDSKTKRDDLFRSFKS